MKNRILLALCGVLAGVPASVLAQAPVPAPAVAPSVSFAATASVVSQYMFRGLNLSSGGLQPSVEASAGNLVLGVWANVPFDGDKVPDSSDPELNLYGSYSFTIEKDVTFAPGFTLYHFAKAPTDSGFYRATFEPNVALSFTLDGVKLTPKVYYDLVLRGPTYELTAMYALPLAAIGSELDFTGTIATYKWKDAANNASPEVKAWGDYWTLGVAMPFQLDAKSKLTIGFAYSEGRRAFTKEGTKGKIPNSLAVGRGVASISYARSF